MSKFFILVFLMLLLGNETANACAAVNGKLTKIKISDCNFYDAKNDKDLIDKVNVTFDNEKRFLDARMEWNTGAIIEADVGSGKIEKVFYRTKDKDICSQLNKNPERQAYLQDTCAEVAFEVPEPIKLIIAKFKEPAQPELKQ